MEHSISKEMAKIAYEALDEKKAVDITIIDIQKVSVLADYLLLPAVQIKIRYRLLWIMWMKN